MRIQRSFRRALKEKRFRSIRGMLTGSSEIKLLEDSFPRGEDGKYRYSKPSEEKSEEKINKLLKKIYKARSGPRTVCFIVLLLIVAVPVVFNLFFLDSLAAGKLENLLETLSGTDITVEKLDIRPLEGSIRLGKLAFSSDTDPMVDSLVLTELAADISWSAVLFRRFVIDELSGTAALNVPRDTAALYPDGNVNEAGSETGGFNLPDFRISSAEMAELIPDETMKLLIAMRSSAEQKSQDWYARLNKESDDITSLGERISMYLSKPLPEKTDIQGWKFLIEEGKSLGGELSDKSYVVEQFENELKASSLDAKRAFERGRSAVSADLETAQNSLFINDDMLNRWVETAVVSIAGPKVSSTYQKIRKIVLRLRDKTEEGDSDVSEVAGKGRMTRGRIVLFPVVLPPRFSIRSLRLSGADISINGTNIGIDQDLAGAASILSINIKSVLSSEITIDGRETAENLISGNVSTEAAAWSVGPDAPGGLITVQAAFNLRDFNLEDDGLFSSQGQVILSDWTPILFLGPSTPSLPFEYYFSAGNGKTNLKIQINPISLNPWKKVITDSLLKNAGEQLRKVIPPEAEEELKALESLIEDWDDKKTMLGTLTLQIESYQSELDAAMDELTAGLPVDIPLPKASGVLGAVGSLFGN
ncbi:MAG: hypothetical protein DRP60_13495 [Spirochaetes bacterium]|nr:MAG: hypothetical protein DRP60_13495 [Spirochaetota bacterium]